MNKIKAMIGFSIKSGNIIYGADNIEQSRKAIYLIIVDNTVSERTLETAKKIAKARAAKLLRLDERLEDLVAKSNCKVVAILDKNMSENIIMNAGSGGGSILD